MSLSTSANSYRDCYALMQGALDDPSGVRMLMTNHDAAIHFRMRCHMARKIDREANSLTYPKGDPLHNTSPFDMVQLTISRDEEGYWLKLEKTNIIPGEVRSLETDQPVQLELPQRTPQIEYEPQRQLPAPQTNEELGAAFEEVLEAKPNGGVRRI